MYYEYEFTFRYKELPSEKESSVFYGWATGANLEDALRHHDFWAKGVLEESTNMDIIGVKEKPCLWSDPFTLENAVKKAFAHPMKAVNAIMKNAIMDDDDKKDLVFAVLSNQPWRFHLDTIVRDWFCEIMSKLK